MKTRVPVFNGRDNEETFTVSLNGVPLNFAEFGVTKVEIVCAGKTIEAGFSGDEISFKPALLDLPAGSHTSQIIIYNTDNPQGLVIAGPGLASQVEFNTI